LKKLHFQVDEIFFLHNNKSHDQILIHFAFNRDAKTKMAI